MRSIYLYTALSASFFLFATASIAQTTENGSDQKIASPDNYGYLPLETYKISDDVSMLKSADINGDGLMDIAVFNSADLQIDLLIQRTPKDRKEADKNKPETDPNEYANPTRFKRVKVAVDFQITGYTLGDFDQDGLMDLAYSGNNKLVVLRRTKSGEWPQAFKYNLSEENVPERWILLSDDLDGDKFVDLIAIGRKETRVYFASKDGVADDPLRLPNASDRLIHSWVEDANEDGLPDIVSIGIDEERPWVIRFQSKPRHFGAELQISLPSPKAFDLVRMPTKGGKSTLQFMGITNGSGQFQTHQLEQTKKEAIDSLGPVMEFAFLKNSSGRNRHLVTGDMNGDGLLDVVSIDGESAQMSVYLQDKTHGLQQPKHFPGLTGIQSVKVAHFNGDKRADLVIVSEREKVIAISQWRDERLTFPKILPSKDTPVTLAVGDFMGSGEQEIAYVSRKRKGIGSSSYFIRKLTFTRADGWQAGDFNGEEAIELKDFRGSPTELSSLDADRDGRSDLLIVSNSGPLTLMTTDGQGVPSVLKESNIERLGTLTPSQISVGKLDGPAIFVADKNFARRIQLDEEKKWKILDQYNAYNATVNIDAAATLDVDGDGENEIVLIDSGSNRLRFLRKENEVYKPWKDLSIPNFSFQKAQSGDFNNDGQADLLIYSSNSFFIFYPNLPEWKLKLVGAFESRVKDAEITDLITGDVGGEDETEIILIDSTNHKLEILVPDEKSGFLSAIVFKIIETKQFGLAGSEPREANIEDVTGDGLKDLIFLAQDRVLLFPQDPGPDPESEEE